MKQGWEIKRLGDICYHESSNISQNQLENEKGDYPIFGASGLIKNVSFFKQDKPYLSIVKDGSGVGRVTKMHSNTSVIGTLQYILPKENIDINFLYYSMISIDFRKFITGAAIPHIYFKNYKDEPILWVPLNEQKRIVAKLDEIFTNIDKAKTNAEKNLQNAKELFESCLQEEVRNSDNSSEYKTLGQISENFGRGKSKNRPRNDKKLYGGSYPFIQTGDIRNCNHFITEYTQTYNDVGLAQSKLWPKGTICITIAANIAETGVLTFDSCFPDSIIGLVVNKKIADTNYIEYLLQSFKVKLQSLGKGSAQANINMETFKYELFPIPILKKQQSIVKKLDVLLAETKKLEAIYKQKISDLEELKKSVLQKAFNGEL
ncbi:MAG: restriction endonuclease subunit S [Ignavibacteria bacterium]